MNFAYPFKYVDKSGKSIRDFNYDAPIGPWRLIWSNLPYHIKEVFYNTFKNNKRYSAGEWCDFMKRYKSDLSRGYSSNDIFPKEFKKISEND